MWMFMLFVDWKLYCIYLLLFQIANVACWLVCIAMICVIVYAPYSDKDARIFTTAESDVYNALHRTGWGVAVCWIVFACATGYGGTDKFYTLKKVVLDCVIININIEMNLSMIFLFLNLSLVVFNVGNYVINYECI